MKVRGERGRSALYIGCVYMPTDVMVQVQSLLMRVIIYLRKMSSLLNRRGRLFCLETLNARVGKSSRVDDVTGMFGEETCNTSGIKLISFLHEVELVVCNGRKLVVEPE